MLLLLSGMDYDTFVTMFDNRPIFFHSSHRRSLISRLRVAWTKDIALALVIGLLVGCLTVIFLKSLYLVLAIVSNLWRPWLLLPLGLALSAWISMRVTSEVYGQGLEHVVHAIHRASGYIEARVIPAKFLSTLLTIGTGGSAGTIGPCAQIGGGIASLVARSLRLQPSERQTLVICGMSAGFAAVLGAPFAGACFAIEALWIGGLSSDLLVPTIIAALTGHVVAFSFGIPNWTLTFSPDKATGQFLLLIVLLAGILFGLCSIVFIETMNLARWVSWRSSCPLPLQGALSGILLAGAGFWFPHNLGLGIDHLQDAVHGQPMPWADMFVKTLFTAATLYFGGSGGIILPLGFVGAMAGSTLGILFQTDPGLFAALGFVSLLAGAANTPLAAMILAWELFGASLIPYAMATCAISYWITGHRSAIPTQILHTPKCLHAPSRLNQEIIDPESLLRPPTWLTITRQWFRRRASWRS